ncbi:hypothetical protein R83H12_02314 [Fibrobacteria bacterium R8-3-H12]
MPAAIKHALAALCLAATTATAVNIVAVLEIIPSGDDVNISISEYRHLTDELRTKAREILPPEYTILTRDNIFQLLPADEKEAECLAESCAVDIGRAIGAEYVTQGSIGKFEGMLTLTVELYESMSGNMLGSFVTESNTASGLLGTIREKAPALFARILPPAPMQPIVQPTAQPAVPEPIPANIPAEPKKSANSLWVALGLDVLGATALGLGAYNNAKAKEYYRESENALKNVQLDGYDERQKEFDSKYKKMQNARTARNIFYATGSALLLGGIAVHIWF